jgi:hypothetical protein
VCVAVAVFTGTSGPYPRKLNITVSLKASQSHGATVDLFTPLFKETILVRGTTGS